MKVCIIPARGGSKRIPRKNIREFCGKPIIAYSIEAAKKTNIFDKIIVSTEDAEIANVALKFGADVPFLRPSDLADDYVGTTPVVEHAVRVLESSGDRIDVICLIYSTAPMIDSEDIRHGYDLLMSNPELDFVFSATEFPSSVFRSFKLDCESQIQPVLPGNELVRSQDLPKCYYDAAQFYWGKRQAFLSGRTAFTAKSRIIEIPRSRSQDIDTLPDWSYAEHLYCIAKTGTLSDSGNFDEP